MRERIQEIKDELIQIRRKIHTNPELGFEEYKTSALIADYLISLGIEVQTNVAKTGVVGIIRGKSDGKTLLIRADIDALPMNEENTFEYASKNKGRMHACGHDVHTAVLLGVAKVLNEIKNSFSGNIKLVFQPAEEAEGGALPMIEEGVMENPSVDGAVAYHVWNYPSGTIGIKPGSITASPDHFNITVTGKGGHGATPEVCINPLEIASRITARLNNIKLDTPGLVTICSIIGGTGENIIPDTALLRGTARALEPQTRKKLYNMIVDISNEEAKKLGGTADIDYRFLYPPGINDEKMVSLFEKAAQEVIGGENIIHMEKPDMTGDDFAYFAERVPSCYVKLGGATSALHTSNFDFDEECISTGVEIMCNFALKFLDM